MNDKKDLEKRLAALESSNASTPKKGKAALPLAAAGVFGIAIFGGLTYLSLNGQEETSLPTAHPEEFQAEGQGFGEIDPFVPPPPPEPEVRIVEKPVEPNEELLAQLAALQSQIKALQNAAEPTKPEDEASSEALLALTDQIAALQASSDAAQAKFQDALDARDRELKKLRIDLDLAQLQSPVTPSTVSGIDDEETRRLAELERRRQEELAFQQARIGSPTIAFGGGSGTNGASELTERTLGKVQDFIVNGALPSPVTQAEVIANPANTVVQGTMIQAVTETALDSSLPGAIRAIISEDVHSFDGSRVLIPRGSRLIGRYQSGADIGQRRVTIAWDRIVMPNNQSVKISAFGGDELGRSGATGKVDTRFGQRFGSAALISLISAAPDVAAARIEDENTATVVQEVGDDFSDATDDVIREYLSLSPIIYVDQGSRITVMVDRDLEIF